MISSPVAHGRTGTTNELILKLSHGTSMAFIDDAPIIFSESRRALFDVNRIAGYIGCRLEDGIGFNQLVAEIIDRGFPAPDAAIMLRRVLADWSVSGLIQATGLPPPSPSPRLQAIAVGGVRLLLRYHDDMLASRVGPIFAHLETDLGPAGTSYDLWTADGFAFLSRNGGPASLMQPVQAAPVLKARLADDVMNDPRWLLALHAGCLHRNGRSLLLAGRPGAGKTTLTSWLTDAGFSYGGDDIAMLNADGKVQGLPFLPSIKSGAWRLVGPKYPDLSRLPVHLRPDGKRVRYPTPRTLAGQTPAPLGWILKLRRRKEGPARLTPIPPALAMKYLLSEAYSRTGEVSRSTLDTLIRTLAAAQSHELHYADPDDAAMLLRRLCDHGSA